ncbi:phosphotransferase [Glycomyces sp. NPDC021274]|uniref:phosphotransferase n=1 Tax=Glycomyces sp. NPDC021274 TaxID=3155120 RepID=UPI00340B1D72
MSADPIDEMARGRFANVRCEGGTVVRHPAVDNAGSLALLRHFEAEGCALTPRVLEASEQRERLSYIPGVTGYPPLTADLRSEDALVSVARAARTIHDLSASFAGRGDYEWHPLETCRPVRDLDVIGHGDLAPWNIVFEGAEVVGIIDWDAAGPMTRSWDMAYLAHQFVPFHLGDDLSSWGWDRPPDRRARLALLCEAYGGLDPEDVVDDAILRLHSTGMFLRQRITAGDPRFEAQRRERHDRGFMAAAAHLAAYRDSLLEPELRSMPRPSASIGRSGHGDEDDRVLEHFEVVVAHVGDGEEFEGAARGGLAVRGEADAAADDEEGGLGRVGVVVQDRAAVEGDEGLAEDPSAASVHRPARPAGGRCIGGPYQFLDDCSFCAYLHSPMLKR